MEANRSTCFPWFIMTRIFSLESEHSLAIVIHAFYRATSRHNKIGVLRMLFNISVHCWTNDVYLEILLAGPVEGSFCQRGSETQATQVFGNFSMNQFQDVR